MPLNGENMPLNLKNWALLDFISISILLVWKKENKMIILRNPQIAELIEAGCAFKSNVIISKNETKEIENK